MKKGTDEAQSALVEGAKQLTSCMKNATAFMMFLTGAIYWAHYYNKRHKEQADEDDHFYTLIVIVERVATPWLLAKDGYINQMADGFAEVIQQCGSEGMAGMTNKVFEQFGFYTGDTEAIWCSNGLTEMIEGFSALTKMLGTMEQYEALSKKGEHLKAA